MPTSRKTSRSQPLNVSVSVSSRTQSLKVSVLSRSRQSVGRSRSRSRLGLKFKRLGLGPQGLVYIPGRHTIKQNIVLKSHPIPTKKSNRRSILKKNYDVTIMTSSGHVTSSVTYSIDRPWALCYRLSIRTIALSGFVSKIFSPKDY